VFTPVPTLGMFKLPVIEIDCRECDRRGKYNRDRAIERHGAGMTMNQFMRLMAKCPRDGNEKHPCRVGCPDLAYMFHGAPFED
jgi:hypothetical protein